MSTVKRIYDSAYRRAQAETTRMRIAGAARKLFLERGYGATTVRAIAESAGVAEPTVYATFQTKKAILTAIVDALDSEAGVLDLIESLKAAHGDPGRQIDLIVAFEQRLYERGWDVYEAVYKAGSVDPELSDLLKQGKERGRAGRVPIVQAWADAGMLNPGLSPERAIDVFTTMSSPWLHRELVHESGWAAEQYQRWLGSSLRRLLLHE